MLRRNRNCFQCGTGCKRIRTNLFNGIGDGDGGQGVTGVERVVANGGNGIGDGDGGQGVAGVERAVPNSANLFPVKHIWNSEFFCLAFVICNLHRPIIQQRILIVPRRERLAFHILREYTRPAGTHHHNNQQKSHEPFVSHKNDLLYSIIIHNNPSSVNAIL